MKIGTPKIPDVKKYLDEILRQKTSGCQEKLPGFREKVFDLRKKESFH